MSFNYEIADWLTSDTEFHQTIFFSINRKIYLFSIFLDEINERQITFDTLENINQKTMYKSSPFLGAGIFSFYKVVEELLQKYIESFGDTMFYALPADERLEKLYKILFNKYHSKEDSLFNVVCTMNRNGGGDRYEIRKK